MPSSLSRREFIASAAATASVLILPACAHAPSRTGTSPNSKLNVACIGVGGKGVSDLEEVGGHRFADEKDEKGVVHRVLKGEGENIVALCDVDANNLNSAASLYPKAKKYTDYRKMLDDMGSQIDAVVVSTPDHSHFPAAMRAIKLGKHVYVQKPLAFSVWEARELTLAARKHKVATQMGNQGHAGDGIRRLKEWIDAGVIGAVTTVHCWTNRPIWPQGIERPQGSKDVPGHLSWDLWLGPAPVRPYNDGYQPFNWRGWLDFGCGALGDMGCHVMDLAHWTLDLGAPTRVSATSTPMNTETFPKSSIVTYQFPARGAKPPVTLVWYDGGNLPPRPAGLEPTRNFGESGSFIIGEKGTIMCGCYGSDGVYIVPETKREEMKNALPPRSIPRSPGHYKEWIDACKGGKPAGSNFDVAGPFTEAVLLGVVALKAGKPIEWDSAAMKITNLPEANKLLKREPRKGWEA